MKIKKRILGLIMAASLACVMALPASAAVMETTGEYEYCSYSTHTTCYTYDYTAIMEFQSITFPGCGKTYNDYSFRIDVRVFTKGILGGEQVLGTVYGSSSTRIASNRSEFEKKLHHIVAFHYVNNANDGDATVYPS